MVSAPPQMSSAALATRFAYSGRRSSANILLNAVCAVAPLFLAPIVMRVYWAFTCLPARGNQMVEASWLRLESRKEWYWPLASRLK